MDQVYVNIRPVNLINAIFCLIVGYSLNGTLLWLIKNQKVGELIKWRWILLQTCLTDIFLISFWFFIQPVIVNDPISGTQWVILNCPFGNLPTQFGFILFNAFYSSLMFMVGAISVQFFFRYLIICRLNRFSLPKYLVALFILLSWLLFLALIRLPAGNYPEPGYEQLPDTFSFYLNGRDAKMGKIFAAFFTRPNQTESAIFWNTFLERSQYGTNLAYLAINLFCAWRIRKFVKKTMTNSQQSQQMEINRQLTINLILQGIVPLVRLLLITLSVYIAYYTNGDEQFGLIIGLYSMIPNSWIPLINPTITLLVIRPYRQFLFRHFCCCLVKKEQIIQIGAQSGETPPSKHRSFEFSQMQLFRYKNNYLKLDLYVHINELFDISINIKNSISYIFGLIKNI